MNAVMAESERLAGWSSRWLKLACDRQRMQRRGNLQSQQDYMLGRSSLAHAKRGRLLRQWWAYLDAQVQVIKTLSPEDIERAELARLKAKYEVD